MLDCLIVGGGAAGLMAAVYLGRYKRDALVVDAGASRLARIPKSRNVPGFPDGIAGQDLWDRMRRHARQFGVPLEQGCIESLVPLEDGGFEARAADDRTWRARFIILATGALDVEPDVPGLGPALAAGQVRYCPVCDGFETQGQRVAVLGHGAHGLREALFVSGFGNEVTWLSLQTHQDAEQAEIDRLRKQGVRIAGQVPRTIRCVAGSGIEVEMHGGEWLQFDVMYPALGLNHASDLAVRLGARVQDDGQLVVDGHMETTVAGLYAAGDVAVDLNQISVAAGHAAIAATAIHNRL